ncbi:MAG: hypothetical protein JNJ40_06520 [Bacteroidia bacterium]|nr:hypothetical protein [Bacteroidia bacterium]
MCDYKVLVHNENGYIILCNSCNHYQISFGTTAVTIKPENFKVFLEQVTAIKDNTDCNGFEKQKRISLNIFSRFAMMVLTYSELICLFELLDEAVFNEQMQTIMLDLNLISE